MENRFPMRNRAAPGYRMYIIWAIRHLPGDPWRRGANLPEYQWLERQP
jgi:5-deoxy-glucuronate isomerase